MASPEKRRRRNVAGETKADDWLIAKEGIEALRPL